MKERTIKIRLALIGLSLLLAIPIAYFFSALVRHNSTHESYTAILNSLGFWLPRTAPFWVFACVSFVLLALLLNCFLSCCCVCECCDTEDYPQRRNTRRESRNHTKLEEAVERELDEYDVPANDDAPTSKSSARLKKTLDRIGNDATSEEKKRALIRGSDKPSSLIRW